MANEKLSGILDGKAVKCAERKTVQPEFGQRFPVPHVRYSCLHVSLTLDG